MDYMKSVDPSLPFLLLYLLIPPSDDQSYTDSSNDKQDDCVSNKSAGPIIIEATAAFVENGMHTSVYVTIICQHSDVSFCLVVHLKLYFQVFH